VVEGKFGFIPEEEEPPQDLALQFKPTPVDRPPHSILELDRVAEAAGFTSREPSAPVEPPRRRRVNREHASRALAIRMTESQFARFLRYADRHELTYSDTIAHLLDIAGEPG
jgi:hypothetical protein